MPNEPLGISFSPFSQQNQQQNQQGGPGARAASPQDAIRILSFRPPRTVGAASPIPQQLLNAPGGAALGGFGPAGGDLEQLLALLFGAGKNMPGGGSFNERPAQGAPMPWDTGGMPWDQPTGGPFGGKAPVPSVRPGQEEPRDNTMPTPGGTAGPGPSAFPNFERPDRGGRRV